MIDYSQLATIAHRLETLRGPLRCRGDLVLEIQQALYGSQMVCLSAEEQAEVLRYYETHGAASGSLWALAAQRRDGRL
jgi:hypothetical protein